MYVISLNVQTYAICTDLCISSNISESVSVLESESLDAQRHTSIRTSRARRLTGTRTDDECLMLSNLNTWFGRQLKLTQHQYQDCFYLCKGKS